MEVVNEKERVPMVQFFTSTDQKTSLLFSFFSFLVFSPFISRVCYFAYKISSPFSLILKSHHIHIAEVCYYIDVLGHSWTEKQW